jgi:6-pyruvoyltetrahydropterin/6-carboxytetrahydropterin synthase
MGTSQDANASAPREDGGEENGAPASSAFRVSVTKDSFVFASAHFITYEGHRCETLHGHNYRAGITIEGELDRESWYVYDFVRLKKLMRRLCDEIDHRVLLPLENPRLTIEADASTVRVAYDGVPRYMFPRRDCALLPIPNTTVEMLARHLVRQVRDELRASDAARSAHLRSIEVEVEENFGQSAFYREELG